MVVTAARNTITTKKKIKGLGQVGVADTGRKLQVVCVCVCGVFVLFFSCPFDPTYSKMQYLTNELMFKESQEI